MCACIQGRECSEQQALQLFSMVDTEGTLWLQSCAMLYDSEPQWTQGTCFQESIGVLFFFTVLSRKKNPLKILLCSFMGTVGMKTSDNFAG